MESIALIEWYGYLGSLIIAVSLTMSDIKRLRWLNMIGAGMFSSYGFIISAWPVLVLNAFIVLINIYHIYVLRRSESKEL
jgi:hypothetical protein